jgi:hypothetical protein
MTAKWGKEVSVDSTGKHLVITPGFFLPKIQWNGQVAIDNVDTVAKALIFITNVEDFTADLFKLEDLKDVEVDLCRFHREFYNPMRTALRVTGKLRLGLLSNRHLHDIIGETVVKAWEEVTSEENSELSPKELLEKVQSHMKWDIKEILGNSAVEDKTLVQLGIFNVKGVQIGLSPNVPAEPVVIQDPGLWQAPKRERTPENNRDNRNRGNGGGYRDNHYIVKERDDRDHYRDNKKPRQEDNPYKRKDICLSNLAYVLRAVGARECAKGNRCTNDHNIKAPPKGKMVEPALKKEALALLESKYTGTHKIAFRDNLKDALNKKF